VRGQLMLRSETRYFPKGTIIADSSEVSKGLMVITSGQVGWRPSMLETAAWPESSLANCEGGERGGIREKRSALLSTRAGASRRQGTQVCRSCPSYTPHCTEFPIRITAEWAGVGWKLITEKGSASFANLYIAHSCRTWCELGRRGMGGEEWEARNGRWLNQCTDAQSLVFSIVARRQP
jgi:hypothetical protein